MRDSKLSASGGVAIIDGICVNLDVLARFGPSPERADEARPGQTGSETGVELVDDDFW